LPAQVSRSSKANNLLLPVPDQDSLNDSQAVLVLGGGVCGLMAALTLAKRGLRPIIVEQRPHPGGLAAGQKRGDNHYDLGVHMVHAFDKEVFEIIRDVMGDERIEVELDAKIRWAGSYYRYPLQFGDMVRGMKPLLLLQCVTGLFATQFREMFRKNGEDEPKDAEVALIRLYGTPLYRFFFEDFTERYWGIHPRELSATFISSKMPRLSAVDLIKKQFAKFGLREKAGRTVESALLNETLHYSRNGAEAMPRRLAEAVIAAGGEIRLGWSAEKIQLDDSGQVTGATLRYINDGLEIPVSCAAMISTIPLPRLTTRLEPAPPNAVIDSATRLRFKPIAIYGLLVNKPKAIDGLYIYYRNRTFHRVGEPKNAGLKVNPADHTVLIVETTCEIGDPKWSGEQSVRDAIARDLQDEGICNPDQIVETHILTSATGYPVFDLGFEPHLEAVRSHLSPIKNLRSVGRQGGFCYPNMHQAMRMGLDAADEIAEFVENANLS